ncbi:6-phospho-3-hexuloisomerase [Bacillus sp. T33-2]|uniref:6-phospho-3-hexuloisomerase n=1 Tax=Bacillus sp. T33-2 TaxID=2054168 RepID=UPI000C78B031|nr:6-phospho-3-hexuloisomerase [Bacillus sp. T33-2]PLR91142.1 6-phospho-3-hexuloisomerase [Bacillus sp. T33-2]
MNTSEYYSKILDELSRSSASIRDEEVEILLESILGSKKVFVAGAGRSGLMARAFAMRLMHMGIESYVVGETITRNFEQEDLLIIGSGSGETASLVSMAQKAKKIGGTVAAVTIFPASTIGNLAQLKITLPGTPKEQSDSGHPTVQPMGALFEQTLLLFFDAVILRLMEQKGLNSANMFGRHANLE